jgi:putative DNA primase/helicase
MLYSNEALQLSENSGALTGRMIVLKMSKSFYGKEDTQLTTKLRAELPGIFNWSLEGLRRRLARGGHFIQTKTGMEYLDLMQELGNPIGTFVEDALIIDPMAKVSKDDVFSAYKYWALKKSLPPGTELAFKRKFLAAIQEHRVVADLDRAGGARQHVYRGVKLNERAQKYVDSITGFDDQIF